MKRLFGIIILLMGFFFTVEAQTATPVATVKQANQRARIAHGQANGELTRAEARALKAQQRHIRRTKKRAKADGEVTVAERKQIARKQRRANRNIKRQKHDQQKRY